MDIEDEGKAAWEGQLSKLLWTVNKLVNDQDRLLRKLNELSSPASTYLGENRLLTRLKTGQSLLIDGRDRGCGLSLIKEGLVERHVMKVLQRTFRKNAVFLDVGANFGFYSIMAGGQIGPRGKVYAFEANPYLGEFIKDSARINGLRLVVEIVNKAVSDQEGVGPIWLFIRRNQRGFFGERGPRQRRQTDFCRCPARSDRRRCAQGPCGRLRQAGRRRQ